MLLQHDANGRSVRPGAEGRSPDLASETQKRELWVFTSRFRASWRFSRAPLNQEPRATRHQEEAPAIYHNRSYFSELAGGVERVRRLSLWIEVEL